MVNDKTLWIEPPMLTKSTNTGSRIYNNAWELLSAINSELETNHYHHPKPENEHLSLCQKLIEIDGDVYDFKAVVPSTLEKLTTEMEKDILDLIDRTLPDEITLNNCKVGTISRDEVLVLKQDDTSRKQWVYVPYLIPRKGDFKEVSNTPDELIEYLNAHLSYNPTGDPEWYEGYFDVSVDNAFIRIDSQVYMVCIAVPSYVHMLTLAMQEDIRSLIAQVGSKDFDPDEFFEDYPMVKDMATAKACTSEAEAKALLERLGISE